MNSLPIITLKVKPVISKEKAAKSVAKPAENPAAKPAAKTPHYVEDEELHKTKKKKMKLVKENLSTTSLGTDKWITDDSNSDSGSGSDSSRESPVVMKKIAAKKKKSSRNTASN